MELYEKKQALKELGSYRPAFLLMKLSFPFYSTRLPLYNLSEKNLSVFIHEYIHFLQDISSYSLLNNAYVYSEYMHSAVNYIYRQKKYFEIPIPMPLNTGNIGLNLFINKTCFGSNEEIDNLFITGIRTYSIPVPFKKDGLNYIKKKVLVAYPFKEIHFGYLAIMESMAYIIETQITHPNSSAFDYPYQSAQLVVKFIFPEFGTNILNVLALCDVSLQYSNPGTIFVEMLEKMQKENWLPDLPEDVYGYVYSNQTEVMGVATTPCQALTTMSMLVERQVKKYIMDQRISPDFYNFVHTILNFGLCYRLAQPYFFLDIAKGGYALKNKSLIYVVNQVGMPIIEDSMFKYHTIPPHGKAYKGVLEFFPAIEQIYKCFYDGNTICEMIDFCQDSEEQYKIGLLKEPAPIVDENCVNSPWKRCADKRLCPYAVLWRHWNLSTKNPLEKKQLEKRKHTNVYEYRMVK